MKESFEQNLNDKAEYGGIFSIQLLFKDSVGMPKKEDILSKLQKHVGNIDCITYNENLAGFACLEHIVHFEDGKAPAQLILTACKEFSCDSIGEFEKSQMWNCDDSVLSECKYQVLASDMLAGGLPAKERADFDSDFVEALAEIYPECYAFYFKSSGKLFKAENIRNHNMTGLNRFVHFGVNARFFNIQGTEDMIVDTLGMNVLYMPDIQYHFKNMNPNWVVDHAYNMACYILKNDNPIKDCETVGGILNGQMSSKVLWKCRYEMSLVQPSREVIDINMRENSAGSR